MALVLYLSDKSSKESYNKSMFLKWIASKVFIGSCYQRKTSIVWASCNGTLQNSEDLNYEGVKFLDKLKLSFSGAVYEWRPHILQN